MLKIGLSSCGKGMSESLFSSYREAGLEAMEISPRTQECPDFDFAQAKKWADEYGVLLNSFHLPFYPFSELEISVSDAEVRERTVAYLAELIRRAGDVGIDKFVIHPSGEPIDEADRTERMETSKESLARLSRVAVASGGVLAVENLPRTCLGRNSDEMLELVSADPDLGICFDTNHLLKENFEDFLRKVGDKVVTIHVSDYDFKDERHWLPGEGELDWNRMYDALLACGYRGPWLYEIDFGTPWTIRRDRNLTCADFVQNAKEIFAQKPLTVIGTPKEGL